MKKVFVLASLWFIANAAFGQAYIITYIKGKIYHNDQLLKLHDRLDGIAQLTSDDKTAELALFSAQKGKFRLSFVDSKPLQSRQKAKNSELYQLIVGNYLLGYTTEKALTTRGEFDLATFFNNADTGREGSNIYLAAGELLPLKSQSQVFGAADKFLICTVSGKDTTCTPITRSAGFLNFDEQTIKGLTAAAGKNPSPVYCFIRRSYSFDNKIMMEALSPPVYVTFLSADYLRGLADTFGEGATNYYRGDRRKLIADVEDQLAYCYGKSFEPAIRYVLTRDLK